MNYIPTKKINKYSLPNNILEVVIVFCIICLILFVTPLFIVGKIAKSNNEVMDWLGASYSAPGKFYPFIGLIALLTAIVYVFSQLKDYRIIELTIDNDEVMFRLRNKFRKNDIVKRVPIIDLKVSVIELQKMITINFNQEAKFIGMISSKREPWNSPWELNKIKDIEHELKVKKNSAANTV